MVAQLPVHKDQFTGDATLGRIQSNVRDIISYLRSLVWVPNQAFAELTQDVTTASATFSDLLTTKITSVLPSSKLLVNFAASFAQITNAGNINFTVSVDGKDIRGAHVSMTANSSASAAILVRVPVTAAVHTVRVRWSTSAATARVAPATQAQEFAALSVQEVP